MPELPINDVLPDLKAVLPEQPEAALQPPHYGWQDDLRPHALMGAERPESGKV